MYRIILLSLVFFLFSCGNFDFQSGKPPIDHQAWDSLLILCVDNEGWVDYDCFLEKQSQLEKYLIAVSENFPDNNSWSREEQLAYWINLYNAATVALIIENYPVSSIKEIKKGFEIPFLNSIWDVKSISVGRDNLSLNDIEHSILRKEFNEPRIHFAINCASISCPVLLNRAYDAGRLEDQLEKQTLVFLNDHSKNRFEKDRILLSPIFNWFGKDFGGPAGIREFLTKRLGRNTIKEQPVSFAQYNWALNEQPGVN